MKTEKCIRSSFQFHYTRAIKFTVTSVLLHLLHYFFYCVLFVSSISISQRIVEHKIKKMRRGSCLFLFTCVSRENLKCSRYVPVLPLTERDDHFPRIITHRRCKSIALSHNTLSLIERLIAPDRISPPIYLTSSSLFLYIRERPVQSGILVLPVGLVHIYHCINDRDPVSEMSASCLFSARPALWCNKYVNMKAHVRRLATTAFSFFCRLIYNRVADISFTIYVSILYLHLFIYKDEH